MIKRRNLIAIQLRFDASRVLERFRILLRHGWLGSHRRRSENQARACKPGSRLASTISARRRERLNRRYGPAAVKLGLARTEAPPGARDPVDT